MSNMTDILTNPDRFFAELSQRDVNLRTPFVIVLVSAIFGFIYAMLAFRVMMSALPEEIAAVAYVFATISAITNLITPFISWVLCAAAFYAVSMLFKGEGSFARVFEFVGYGFVPMILASVVGLIAIMIMAPAAEFSLDNPEIMQHTMMQHLSSQDPAMMVSTIIQILLLLWGVGIWVLGVKHARNLGTGHAIITVLAVPVAFFLVWSLLIYLMAVA